MKVTIGGERLGSGKKMQAEFNNYERSTHDLGYVWRSTMAAGTLVPFMCKVGLPGDTFDINLGCSVLTHPTIGPLFGSYKVQLDVFKIPMRLYLKSLHNNALNIGMNMSNIKLPQIKLLATNVFDKTKPIDNQQINPSSIFSYLGIRGLGRSSDSGETEVWRTFNAIPFIAYYDIYKQYYANKQESNGYIIHTLLASEEPAVDTITVVDPTDVISWGSDDKHHIAFEPMSVITIQLSGTPPMPNIEYMVWRWFESGIYYEMPLQDVFHDIIWNSTTYTFECSNFIDLYRWVPSGVEISCIKWNGGHQIADGKPRLQEFPLEGIDQMREHLLTVSDKGAPVMIDNGISIFPYQFPLEVLRGTNTQYACMNTQEGLAIKTYNSDLFNNWLDTEWIDGADGISKVTAVSTAGGSFTIDELNLSRKIYDMLNRIALSGGTYDDWLDSVYTEERNRGQENPAYVGGLIKELVFQEVVSNSASGDEPLGTLAGRGVMAQKHKGGQIIVKIDEPSYIMGIVSLTPRIDYSQGNSWDMNLKTMDDFHKPALDQIGFQDLVTDQMAWFDTDLSVTGAPLFRVAGKQPAWMNYMTAVNEVRGNFADPDSQMFMTLNRRYEMDWQNYKAKDITTYIDPSKFNYIFADTRLDAQNFWCQIGVDITARRKMSAKIIPNL